MQLKFRNFGIGMQSSVGNELTNTTLLKAERCYDQRQPSLLKAKRR